MVLVYLYRQRRHHSEQGADREDRDVGLSSKQGFMHRVSQGSGRICLRRLS